MAAIVNLGQLMLILLGSVKRLCLDKSLELYDSITEMLGFIGEYIDYKQLPALCHSELVQCMASDPGLPISKVTKVTNRAIIREST